MQPIKVVIADDEKLAREAIKLQLQKEENIELVAECTNGREVLEKISTLKPDIIFLDIQMPYLSGLEVLDQMDKAYTPSVIIVSAYDKHALEAFDKDAIDYLIKPYTDDRFEKAFRKAIKHAKPAIEEKQQQPQSLQELMKILKQFSPDKISTLSIKDGTKIILVPVADIVLLEAAGNYVSIHTTAKKLLHKETMQVLEQKLPSNFVRVHKSTIVNTAFITEFHSLYNGDYIIKLKGGKEVRLSRNYKNRIEHLL